MDSDGPSLKTTVHRLVALKDLERDALLAKSLGQAESTQATAHDKNMHYVGW